MAERSARTVAYYDSSAESFWEGTQDHDVSQNMDALVRNLNTQGDERILDFGCGPGRDLVAWKKRGCRPVGLDGALRFCEMARALSGCEVLHQDFSQLDLPEAHFDGVFANASLFHVPLQELPRVLQEIRASLRPSGILFTSNPRGSNEEGWSGRRYGSYLDWELWKTILNENGFAYLEHYYRPTGRPREEQPWLASVWRKSNLSGSE